jgi:hypothetical protein
LKDFWWVIFPVPVTLNRFLALEFVLTFGIWNALCVKPYWRIRTGGPLMEPFGGCKGMIKAAILRLL